MTPRSQESLSTINVSPMFLSRASVIYGLAISHEAYYILLYVRTTDVRFTEGRSE